MRLSAPFRAEGEHIGAELPGARVLFTTRRGGVSDGPYTSLNLGWLTADDADRVQVNRERVAALAGVAPPAFAQGRQVHGASVRVRREAPDPAEWPPGPADGQATDRRDTAAIVVVADCLPVAVAGDGAVAMLHCGWRGLAAGIVAAGVAALRELGVSGPLAAAIGPGAGRCCYEAGEEVHAAFADLGPEVRDGPRLDLTLIARRRLEAAGVQTVHVTGLCTICTDPGRFFSHRRDGGVTGRQAGVAWRT